MRIRELENEILEASKNQVDEISSLSLDLVDCFLITFFPLNKMCNFNYHSDIYHTSFLEPLPFLIYPKICSSLYTFIILLAHVKVLFRPTLPVCMCRSALLSSHSGRCVRY